MFGLRAELFANGFVEDARRLVPGPWHPADRPCRPGRNRQPGRPLRRPDQGLPAPAHSRARPDFRLRSRLVHVQSGQLGRVQLRATSGHDRMLRSHEAPCTQPLPRGDGPVCQRREPDGPSRRLVPHGPDHFPPRAFLPHRALCLRAPSLQRVHRPLAACAPAGPASGRHRRPLSDSRPAGRLSFRSRPTLRGRSDPPVGRLHGAGRASIPGSPPRLTPSFTPRRSIPVVTSATASSSCSNPSFPSSIAS